MSPTDQNQAPIQPAEPRIEFRVGGPVATNCFAVTDPDTGAWAIVDPVEGVAELWADKLAASAPERIIVTHGHFDHTGGLAELRRLAPQAPVHVHPDSKAMLESEVLSGAALFGIPFETSGATDFFREGDTVSVGNCRFEIFETPGHCPGSVMLVSGKQAIVGDAIFAGSVGRWDLPGADYDTLARSIATRIMTLPDDVALHPGHGPSTTVGRERRTNAIVAEMLDAAGGRPA